MKNYSNNYNPCKQCQEFSRILTMHDSFFFSHYHAHYFTHISREKASHHTYREDIQHSARGDRTAHLQDLDHHLLIVGDVDCLEHFAVLPSAQFTNQLVVLLVAIGTDRETVPSLCDYVRTEEDYFQPRRAIKSPSNFESVLVTEMSFA